MGLKQGMALFNITPHVYPCWAIAGLGVVVVA